MSENANIEDEWLAKTGRTAQPEQDQEYLPAQPKTIDLDALNEYLDRRAAPDHASNREYFHEKRYEFDKIVRLFLEDYAQRQVQREVDREANPIQFVVPRHFPNR